MGVFVHVGDESLASGAPSSSQSPHTAADRTPASRLLSEVPSAELDPVVVSEARSPERSRSLDDDGLLPNRPIAFWPYTDINSPHLKLTNAHIFVHATMTAGAMKIGFPNPHGWMAYWLEGMLFVKTAVFQPNATYYDFGSSSECYCNDKFLELETLGPRTIIQPGDSVTHRELWYVFTDVPMTSPEALAARIPHLLGDRS